MSAEKIYWINKDGGSIDLTDNVNYSVLEGIDGRWMPPFEFIADEVYRKPGDYMRLRKTKMREVTIPLAVFGTSATDLHEKLRVLTDAFSPADADGRLKVVSPDGITFLLNCHYYDGMTFPETYDTGNCKWRKFVAIFQANDPFWWNALENERLLATSFIYDAPYTIYDNDLVYNAGDVDAYPIWTVYGALSTPLLSINIHNMTTGKGLYFSDLSSYMVDNFDALYVDTRPGKASVNVNHTTNVFSHMVPTSDFFPLIPGINQIEVTVMAAASADAHVWCKCRWRDMYYGV